MFQSLEGQRISACKLFSALKSKVTRVELKSKSVGLQCFQLGLRDVEGT